MPWTEMIFRGRDRVWILTDEAGEPVVDTGRVTMKYKPDEAAKSYSAALENLSTSKGQPPKTTSAKTSPPPPADQTRPAFDELVWQDPAGAIESSTMRPDELVNEARPDIGVYEFYTDGACSGNPGRCGWGFLMRTTNQYYEAFQFLGIGTNNIAELMAIKAALDHIPDPDAVIRIHTDSSYSLGVITKDWKAKANTDLVATLRKQMRGYKARPQIIKVKGHSGHPLNERADFLATSSILK
jgi:ribonuclease HI